MAWTTPRTWTTAEVVTAAMMNTLRDNLNTFDAVTAGSILVTDGTDPVWRIVGSASDNSATATTTSTSYLALGSWTGGATVASTITTGTKALVILTARTWHDTAGGSVFLSFAVSGATTTPASDSRAGRHDSAIANAAGNPAVIETVTLTAGSNTFTVSGRVSAGTGTVNKVDLAVIPLS